MFEPIRIALCSALVVAAIAAVFDWRTAQIPNWLTLPPIAIAPFAYGEAFGFEHALRCIAATLLSALVPYVLFRLSAMGGGDVKLFAALGAINSFDLLAGLEIQLSAFSIGLVLAIGGLARKGSLLRFFWAVATRPFLRTSPGHSAVDSERVHHVSLRMGGAILIATSLFAMPRMMAPWAGF
jgi:prepilin peptidase CpaA